jgi:hypothetical protein
MAYYTFLADRFRMIPSNATEPCNVSVIEEEDVHKRIQLFLTKGNKMVVGVTKGQLIKSTTLC